MHDVAERHASALADLGKATALPEVLGIEGRAARDYFQGFEHVAPGTMTDSNPPTAPRPGQLPAVLGYGMLRVAVHGALEQVGLDPYLGYLYGIRSGKPALALDLMEEFRPLLVDRLVLTLVNRDQFKSNHTESLTGGAPELADDGRRFFL